ncbi:MAG: hypothetical protein ABR613_06110 [Actinomycetota bacterium]
MRSRNYPSTRVNDHVAALGALRDVAQRSARSNEAGSGRRLLHVVDKAEYVRKASSPTR